MKTLALLVLTVLTIAAHGQDYRTQARQYEQRQQDNKVAEQRVHQQYLNNLPNRTNSSTSNSAAVAELERLFRKGNTSPVVSKEEALNKRLEFMARWRKDIEKSNAYEKTYGTLADTLKASGFTYAEAYSMSKYAIDRNVSDSKATLEIMNAKIALNDFKALYPTASYEKLLQLALNYRMAGLTCVSSLRHIEQRFPETKQEIDLMVLKVMPAFYNYKYITLDIEGPSSGHHSYMTNMFTALLKKYPMEANNMADTCLVSPYGTMQATQWLKNGELDQKAAIFLYILQSQESSDLQAAYMAKDRTSKLNKLKGCLQFFRYHPSYLNNLTTEDWKKIEESKGLTRVELKEYMTKLSS